MLQRLGHGDARCLVDNEELFLQVAQVLGELLHVTRLDKVGRRLFAVQHLVVVKMEWELVVKLQVKKL